MEVSSMAEQLLFTTARVEACDAAGKLFVGTSFFFYYMREGRTLPCLVTNKHVVQDKVSCTLFFVQGRDGKPLLGTGYSIELSGFGYIWYGHPSDQIDVAIIPFLPIRERARQQRTEIYHHYISSDDVPSSEEALSKLDALEDVVFVGYPRGIWDSTNLLPVIRRGTTATPVAVDFCGEKQFLIDASVFPGSSGSPVFLYNSGIYFDRGLDSFEVGKRLLFLGILSSGFFLSERNEIRILSKSPAGMPFAVSEQMIDLGIVFKPSTIMETAEAFLRELDTQDATAA